MADQALLVARVVPDVSGLDKQFDYLVPSALLAAVQVGVLVRVELHGRRVGGWVVAVGPPAVDTPVHRLRPILKVSSVGPPSSVVDLCAWAAARWGSPRIANLLTAASPPTMVAPRGDRTGWSDGSPGVGASARPDGSDATDGADGTGGSGGPDGSGGMDRLHRFGPLTDPLPLVQSVIDDAVASHLPVVVVHPSAAGARALATRLRRSGRRVALVPDDWAMARFGPVDAVVGGRSAVWAPCPRVGAIVILDEHDDALQEERSPTWHARDIAIERAGRDAATCVLASPCPSPVAEMWAERNRVRVTSEPLGEQRRGWPVVQVVDRNDVEPWKRSLVSSELIVHLRSRARVLCVLNTTGRARLLACRRCRAVQRCERCDAAVSLSDASTLVCARCATERPEVCQACGSGALANVKPGVSRLREELEAAAGRPVAAVAASLGSEVPEGSDVFVGTEAALHRLRNIDVVAFLDLDSELFAPRYRATQHTVALLVRAARLVGGRRDAARLLVQTSVPEHQVLRAVQLADLSPLVESELAQRRLLDLPPFGALASVVGDGAAAWVRSAGLQPGGTDHDVMVRAADWDQLGSALAATPRPKGSRLRVEVDPPRR